MLLQRLDDSLQATLHIVLSAVGAKKYKFTLVSTESIIPHQTHAVPLALCPPGPIPAAGPLACPKYPGGGIGGITRLKGMGMFIAVTWLGPALIIPIWSWVWKYMLDGRPGEGEVTVISSIPNILKFTVLLLKVMGGL